MTISPIIRLMRPAQWVKNIFILAPLFFSFKFFEIRAWIDTLLAMFAFIFMSAAVYIINDICDAEKDRHHPRKKLRPIAAHQIETKTAIIWCLIFLSTAVTIAASLNLPCVSVLIIYMLINLAYNYGLKRIAILDVIVIAIGFVLRVVIGGLAIQVNNSPWILLATFLLALFLGFGKRYNELNIIHEHNIRESLLTYNKLLLEKLISCSCMAAFTFYAIYTVEIAKIKNATALIYTIVFVVFGLFRYLQALYVNKEGGEPERLIFSDKILIINNVLWLTSTLWILR